MTQQDTFHLPEMSTVWQETLHWQPTAQQQTQLQHLYELIMAGNRQLNLTRITEPTEFWEKHLWDSLRGIAPFLIEELRSPVESDPASFKVIDVGTGGGFPGVPVAIARSDWQITLADSTQKKIAFLDTLVQALGLAQVHPLASRAEELGQQRQHREAYDLALVRAVGSASVCAEYVLPLLKLEGQAVLYRGQWSAEETEALRPAVAQLGGAIVAVEAFTTPVSQSVRHCLYLQKVAPTPAEFPRAVGIPGKQPL